MPLNEKIVGGHVEVYLRNPGDFTYASIGGIRRTETEVIRDLGKIEDAVRSKLSKFDDEFGDCQVVYEKERTCEFCGYDWTEDSALYNGGCCDEDEKHNPHRREGSET
jgi:hypothetical protein